MTEPKTIEDYEDEHASDNETPNERFLRLVNHRLPVAVKRIRMIGNLASPNYKYTAEQVEQVMAVLRGEVEAVENAFSNEKPEDIPTIG